MGCGAGLNVLMAIFFLESCQTRGYSGSRLEAGDPVSRGSPPGTCRQALGEPLPLAGPQFCRCPVTGDGTGCSLGSFLAPLVVILLTHGREESECLRGVYWVVQRLRNLQEMFPYSCPSVTSGGDLVPDPPAGPRLCGLPRPSDEMAKRTPCRIFESSLGR